MSGLTSRLTCALALDAIDSQSSSHIRPVPTLRTILRWQLRLHSPRARCWPFWTSARGRRLLGRLLASPEGLQLRHALRRQAGPRAAPAPAQRASQESAASGQAAQTRPAARDQQQAVIATRAGSPPCACPPPARLGGRRPSSRRHCQCNTLLRRTRKPRPRTGSDSARVRRRTRPPRTPLARHTRRRCDAACNCGRRRHGPHRFHRHPVPRAALAQVRPRLRAPARARRCRCATTACACSCAAALQPGQPEQSASTRPACGGAHHGATHRYSPVREPRPALLAQACKAPAPALPRRVQRKEWCSRARDKVPLASGLAASGRGGRYDELIGSDGGRYVGDVLAGRPHGHGQYFVPLRKGSGSTEYLLKYDGEWAQVSG